MSAVLRIAETIASNSPTAVQAVKRAVRMSQGEPIEQAAAIMMEAHWRSVVHPDRVEGIRAFNEDVSRRSRIRVSIWQAARRSRLVGRDPSRQPRRSGLPRVAGDLRSDEPSTRAFYPTNRHAARRSARKQGRRRRDGGGEACGRVTGREIGQTEAPHEARDEVPPCGCATGECAHRNLTFKETTMETWYKED